MYNVKCCYEITTSRLMEKLDDKADTLNHHFWKIFTSKFEQNWMKWSEIVSWWQDGFKCLELHIMARLIELLKWYATKFDAILVASGQSWIPEPRFSQMLSVIMISSVSRSRKMTVSNGYTMKCIELLRLRPLNALILLMSNNEEVHLTPVFISMQMYN